MFKHILVPVDGSATSMQAVGKAAGLAKAFGSEVTAVYVLDPYPFTGVGADFAYGQAQYLSAATAEANKALEDVKKLLDEAGVSTKTLVGEGHAIHEGVVRVAENVGADLIVMGSHGRRGKNWCWAALRNAFCKLRTFRCWLCARKRSACSRKNGLQCRPFCFLAPVPGGGPRCGMGPHLFN